MFVSVDAADAGPLLDVLGNVPGVIQAGATIYGTWPDLCGDRWRISTAEI
jgi:hypothetical protein